MCPHLSNPTLVLDFPCRHALHLRLLYQRQQCLHAPPFRLKLTRGIAFASNKLHAQCYRACPRLTSNPLTDTSASSFLSTSIANSQLGESAHRLFRSSATTPKCIGKTCSQTGHLMLSHSKQLHEFLKKAKTPSFRPAPIVIALVAFQNEPSLLPCLATPRLLAAIVNQRLKKSLS